jgi:hypothetical protein
MMAQSQSSQLQEQEPGTEETTLCPTPPRLSQALSLKPGARALEAVMSDATGNSGTNVASRLLSNISDSVGTDLKDETKTSKQEVTAQSQSPSPSVSTITGDTRLWTILLPQGEEVTSISTSPPAFFQSDPWFSTLHDPKEAITLPPAVQHFLASNNKEQRYQMLMQTADWIRKYKISIPITTTALSDAVDGATSSWTAGDLQAIFRFLIILITSEPLDSKSAKAIHSTFVNMLQSVCQLVVKLKTPHSDDTSDFVGNAIAMMLFYVHSLVLHHGRIFLMAPLWRNLCDLLQALHNTMPQKLPQYAVTERSQYCKTLLDRSVEALQRYLLEGNDVVQPTLMLLSNQTASTDPTPTQQEPQHNSQHIKVVSFLVARFVALVPLVHQHYGTQSSLLTRPPSTGSPFYGIVQLLMQWRGMLYTYFQEGDRNSSGNNNTSPLIKTLASLQKKVEQCFDDTLVVIKSSNDSSATYNSNPSVFLIKSFDEAIHQKLVDDDNSHSSQSNRHNIAVGLTLHLYQTIHLLTGLPHVTNNDHHELNEEDGGEESGKYHMLEMVCVLVLHSLSPQLCERILSPSFQSQTREQQGKQPSSLLVPPLWHALVEILNQCMDWMVANRVASATHLHIAKWLAPQQPTAKKSEPFLHPLSKELLLQVAAQYVERHVDVPNDNDNDVGTSNAGLQLVYTLAKLASESLLLSCEDNESNNTTGVARTRVIRTVSVEHGRHLVQALRYIRDHMARQVAIERPQGTQATGNQRANKVLHLVEGCIFFALQQQLLPTSGKETPCPNGGATMHMDDERVLIIAPLLQDLSSRVLLSDLAVGQTVQLFCRFLALHGGDGNIKKRSSPKKSPFKIVLWPSWFERHIEGNLTSIGYLPGPICFAILAAVLEDCAVNNESKNNSSNLLQEFQAQTGTPVVDIVGGLVSCCTADAEATNLVSFLRFLQVAAKYKCIDATQLFQLIKQLKSIVLLSNKSDEALLQQSVLLETTTILNHVGSLLPHVVDNIDDLEVRLFRCVIRFAVF